MAVSSRFYAFFFLAFWVADSLLAISFGRFYAMFWFCNFSLLILGIAFYCKSSEFVSIFFSVALIFQPLWIIDWIFYGLSGQSILGLPSFYLGYPELLFYFTVLKHVLMLPIAFIGWSTLDKPKNYLSRIFIGLAVVGTILFSYFLPGDHNVNCARDSCVGFISLSGEFYLIFWILLVVVISQLLLFIMPKIYWLSSRLP